ncbi:MAG: hypothetical protein KGL39_19020 [Patescibacteria group bacterium]|nr:hypothetical protein [Patescibacteria group bacterium]
MSKFEDLIGGAQSAQKAPDHVNATFAGVYYKGTATGSQDVNFSETVKIPVSWLYDAKDLLPTTIFQTHYAERVMRKKDPSYGGLRKWHLEHVDRLPLDLDFDCRLIWANYDELKKIASTKAPVVAIECYQDAASLRHAIQQALENADAFEKVQARQFGLQHKKKLDREKELAALGY